MADIREDELSSSSPGSVADSDHASHSDSKGTARFTGSEAWYRKREGVSVGPMLNRELAYFTDRLCR